MFKKKIKKKKKKDVRRKRRDEISHRLVSGLGGCIAPQLAGLWGIAEGVGWGAGSFLLSPSSLESLTEKKQEKKTHKKNVYKAHLPQYR